MFSSCFVLFLFLNMNIKDNASWCLVLLQCGGCCYSSQCSGIALVVWCHWNLCLQYFSSIWVNVSSELKCEFFFVLLQLLFTLILTNVAAISWVNKGVNCCCLYVRSVCFIVRLMWFVFMWQVHGFCSVSSVLKCCWVYDVCNIVCLPISNVIKVKKFKDCRPWRMYV